MLYFFFFYISFHFFIKSKFFQITYCKTPDYVQYSIWHKNHPFSQENVTLFDTAEFKMSYSPNTALYP